MSVLYNGDRYDHTEKADDLSVTVLKSAVSEITYAETDNEEFKNKIVMTIKQ